jgi:hypothetical protein
MPDDKSKKGGQDRSRVSETEDYEVRYFADRHGANVNQAHELIRKHGSNREKLDTEATKLK